MTSFANKMQIFLWQIATVIPIKGTRASVNMPGFQTKNMFAKQAIKLRGKIKKSLPQTMVMVNDFASCWQMTSCCRVYKALSFQHQITPDEDTRTGVSKRWVVDAILCGDCIH